MTEALVLAHGAFHGPWCWHPTILRLEKQGIRCVAVDLNRGGAKADRIALQSVVDELRDEGCTVHAIGHSLGCIAVGALDPETLATAMLLAGPVVDAPNVPDARTMIEPDFIKKLQTHEDGRGSLSREDARGLFYHRCTNEETEWALDRLRPTFVYGAEQPDPDKLPIWDALPVTYIACSDDRAVLPAYQAGVCEALAGSISSVTLDSDHSPMLGAPDALAEVVISTIRKTQR